MTRLRLALAALLLPASAAARPVLLVSLDGLRAADARDVGQMPRLAALRAAGSAAAGVRGVWPTLTYPSHTTLVTGRPPAEHGIGGNEVFDPLARQADTWMWEARAIRGDTLWAAVRRAGLTSAAINWPVTVGAPIDFNLPQVWRIRSADDADLARSVATPGLERGIAAGVGAPYPLGSDPTCDADAVRARYAAALLAADHPALVAVHLECLDHAQHDFGPDSPQAAKARARLDAILGILVDAARAAQPAIAVAVVSDHGFAPVQTAVNLTAAFRSAGFLVGAGHDWLAAPWPMSGTAAVVLHHPADRAVRARVHSLLRRLAADPRLGIDRILSGRAAAATGGTTRAAFWVVFRPGFAVGGNRAGALVQPAAVKGTHGYPPDLPDMLAMFVLDAPGRRIPAKIIDMRSIAPVLARILGVQLR